MRTDVRQRLKALGATDTKIAALRAEFDDDMIAALLGQLEATAKAASDQRIAYKEHSTMPPTQLPPLAYVEETYRLCDMVDAIADSRGDAAANLYIRRLIGQTVKDFPQAAKRVLGATDATVRLATYKATVAGDAIDQLGARFLAMLREAGDDEARAWLEDAIAEMEADDGGDAQPAMQPSAKMTDSGAMSKSKAYRPADDPYATASGADQLDQGQRVAAVDMRPR